MTSNRSLLLPKRRYTIRTPAGKERLILIVSVLSFSALCWALRPSSDRRPSQGSSLAALSVPTPLPRGRFLAVTATAYCPGPCRICQTRGRTYTDQDAHSPGVAVSRNPDFRVVPLGSRVSLLEIKGVQGRWVPFTAAGLSGDLLPPADIPAAIDKDRCVAEQRKGYPDRLLPVDDVGGGVRQGQIDIRARSHLAARRFGRRRVFLMVLPPAAPVKRITQAEPSACEEELLSPAIKAGMASKPGETETGYSITGGLVHPYRIRRSRRQSRLQHQVIPPLGRAGSLENRPTPHDYEPAFLTWFKPGVNRRPSLPSARFTGEKR